MSKYPSLSLDEKLFYLRNAVVQIAVRVGSPVTKEMIQDHCSSRYDLHKEYCSTLIEKGVEKGVLMYDKRAKTYQPGYYMVQQKNLTPERLQEIFDSIPSTSRPLQAQDNKQGNNADSHGHSSKGAVSKKQQDKCTDGSKDKTVPRCPKRSGSNKENVDYDSSSSSDN